MNKLPSHLHVFEGSLYRAGVTTPLRENYAQSHVEIKSCADMKASLRAGPNAWPGGYSIVFFTSDGALICSECARKNFRSVAWSIRNRCADGWQIIASGIEAVSAECVHELNATRVEQYQIGTVHCDHCSKEFGELA